MTRCFCEAHPEVVSALGYAPSSSDPFPGAQKPLTWQSWVVTETAQRTLFLANMINFFANRDLFSKKQSPYYDRLENDLVLKLPLPCSHGLWIARSEEEWFRVKQSEATSSNPGSYSLTTEPFDTGQPTLQNLLSNNTEEQLRNIFGKSYGITDSDSLRNLIVIAALEQFT
jgi:hypothetical protein